jgi:hypothetical protein
MILASLFSLRIPHTYLRQISVKMTWYVCQQSTGKSLSEALSLHQLTHNMTTDCSLNYKFDTWKFQAQTWGEHVVNRNCFRHSEQILYTTCSPHVLQKEELLKKIYLYDTNLYMYYFNFKYLWDSNLFIKGQLISKCLFAAIVWTKISMKKIDKFCPRIWKGVKS